jgi:hypothetical protein
VDPTVTDVPERSRFEMRDGDDLVGWLDYRPAGKSVILAHTEVVDPHERKGLGGTLVREAMQQLGAAGRTSIPTCPFAAAYIRRHPDLAEHVNPSLRAQFARS